MSKNKRIKATDFTSLKKLKLHIKETNSRKCIISLEKVINCKDYGLCLDSNHSQFKNQNSKYYNTKLIKLFHFLSQKTWDEIYQLKKNSENGYEHMQIEEIEANNVKTHFIKNCSKNKDDKFDVFRFGNQEFRACGFRKEDTFYLVCIDYDYSLYKHKH